MKQKKGLRAEGTNPRALGTNPRATKTNPRHLRKLALKDVKVTWRTEK